MLVYLSRFARLLTTPVILGGILGLVNVLRSLPFLIEQTGDRLQERPVPCHSLLLGWGESSQQGSMRPGANVRRSGGVPARHPEKESWNWLRHRDRTIAAAGIPEGFRSGLPW